MLCRGIGRTLLLLPLGLEGFSNGWGAEVVAGCGEVAGLGPPVVGGGIAVVVVVVVVVVACWWSP